MGNNVGTENKRYTYLSIKGNRENKVKIQNTYFFLIWDNNGMGQIPSHLDGTGTETSGMGGTGTEKNIFSWDGTGTQIQKKCGI